MKCFEFVLMKDDKFHTLSKELSFTYTSSLTVNDIADLINVPYPRIIDYFIHRKKMWLDKISIISETLLKECLEHFGYVLVMETYDSPSSQETSELYFNKLKDAIGAIRSLSLLKNGTYTIQEYKEIYPEYVVNNVPLSAEQIADKVYKQFNYETVNV